MVRSAAAEQALRDLRQLQDRANEFAVDDEDSGTDFLADRVLVAPCGLGFAVEYHGRCYGDAWEEFLAGICKQQVADHIVSIVIGGPDEGANGIRDWAFDTLIKTDARFPALRHFHMQTTEPHHHNATIITRSDAMLEEAGVIANIVGRMPVIEELTIPNYPSADFFELSLDNLAILTIGAAYVPGDFIRLLSKSANLPGLRVLDFADSEQPFSEHAKSDKKRESVSFGDYSALFSSPHFDQIKVFRLRNAILSEQEFLQLQAKRPKLQFLAILSGRGTYVSHWPERYFPYEHIILNKSRWFGSAAS
jgi:hypothetical protein